MQIHKRKMAAWYFSIVLFLFSVQGCEKSAPTEASTTTTGPTRTETLAKLEAHPWRVYQERKQLTGLSYDTLPPRVYTFSNGRGTYLKNNVPFGDGFTYLIDSIAGSQITMRHQGQEELPNSVTRDAGGNPIDTIAVLYCIFPDSITMYLHEYPTMDPGPFASPITKTPIMVLRK